MWCGTGGEDVVVEAAMDVDAGVLACDKVAALQHGDGDGVFPILSLVVYFAKTRWHSLYRYVLTTRQQTHPKWNM